jgi:hypothetical protein
MSENIGSVEDMAKLKETSKWNRFFAVEYFNGIWAVFDKPEKEVTDEDKENIIHSAHASFIHWMAVEGKTPENVSTGYWMLSRVYAVSKNGIESLKYAKKALDISEKENLSSFSKAYNYETMARALKVLDEISESNSMKAKAAEMASKVKDDDERKMIEDDLKTI